jgi:hypothetical protein
MTGATRRKELAESHFRGVRKPLCFSDVLYVPGLTKNLILVSTLEDK